ncbi:anti-sigma factor family protein [Sporosarcina limicola]|uniref:Anti-sigma-W factor RsiW n=1 Tax=Sporosarcina limicola TaxID=34101 RepID=A0A927MFU6_9BACL|nr:anti-sigma factor [Sporosarcina limicola]MBE1553078.1 anti-sigma factor RsiW [Sporosarcina limicola]
MNTCPEQIVHYMHAYLDGEISRAEERELKEHLDNCTECKEIMNSLSESITLLGSVAQVKAPESFVGGVMARLPKEKSRAGAHRWLRSHPFLAAAAMFFVLMSATLFSSYGNDQQFSVTKQPNLIIDGQTVLVPKGEIVKGDIVVENGELRIEGEVDGNVTVIRGSKYMASTAVVTGESEEIDKLFDWLWYKMKNTAKDIFSSSKEDGQDED